MNLESLRPIVALGESDQREFKKTTGELRGGMESLCAFLNGSGGQVFFGVTEAGKIRGQDISDATLQEVAREIVKLDPPATVMQSRISVEATREVLVLEVSPGPQAPYCYNGRPYRRVTSTTSLMPQAEYKRRLLERSHALRRWENQVAARYRPADLDLEEIRWTLSDAREAGRLAAPTTDPLDALEKLKVIDNGQILQAAVVAFAKEMLPEYPQCALRLARFRGTTKNEFLDQRQITGHAFHLLREAELFLRRHLPVRGRLEPGVMQRQDEPLFPLAALREALVNALCHRDYSIHGGAVSVAIYDDRLEIESAGLLPFGLTVLDLKRKHPSKPRNPLLANLFYLRGLIERWGSGTQRLVELCVKAGHPEPQFEEAAGSVTVTFPIAGYSPPHRIEHDLTDRQRRILHILGDGRQRTAKQVTSEFGTPIASATLRRELTLLRDLGLIESGGHGRGAFWRLRRTPSSAE